MVLARELPIRIQRPVIGSDGKDLVTRPKCTKVDADSMAPKVGNPPIKVSHDNLSSGIVYYFALANSFRLSRRNLLYLMSVTGFIVTGSDKFGLKLLQK
jgi:hypothetical protein